MESQGKQTLLPSIVKKINNFEKILENVDDDRAKTALKLLNEVKETIINHERSLAFADKSAERLERLNDLHSVNQERIIIQMKTSITHLEQKLSNKYHCNEVHSLYCA